MQRRMDNIAIRQLEESAMEAAWIQWRSIGSFIESDRMAKSIVDPEALLLVSLALHHRERRLSDILASWARSGSKIFSVQRAKNLLKWFPEVIKARLAEFAWIAKTEGSDFRWESLAGPGPGPTAQKRLPWKSYPATWQSSALLLRLRLAFGVGIVPDLLSYLMSLEGEWASARLVAKATDFSIYSIRRTANNMAASRLLESTQAKPMQYRVKPEEWRRLLSIDGEFPVWRYWYQVYSLVANVINIAGTGELLDLSPYLLGSRLRDIVEAHEDAFILNRIEVPDPRRFPGEEYIHAFNDTISMLASWVRDSV